MRLAVVLIACTMALSEENAAAHAIVTDSSLAQHPVKARAATNVVLRFNSGIETGLSQVFLASKNDILRRLSIRAGKKPGEMIIDIPALRPGDYALKYKVFAADGHLTEDVIRFHVSE
jgi:copper resistance protein C